MTMRESIAAARISGPLRPEEGAATFEFRFGANDPTFAGHFPTRAILPGIFQSEMTRMAAEWVLGGALAIREICKAKFLRPILPEDLVRLDLKLAASGGAIQARAAFSVGGERAGETILQLWRNA